MENTNTRDFRLLGWTLTIAAIAFYVGDRWGMLASTHRDLIEGLTEALSLDLLYEILLEPLAFSFEAVPLICGLTLFVAIIYLFGTFAGDEHKVRTRDEHGSSRRGDVRDAKAYRDCRDPDNNIILSKNTGLAIERRPWVKKYPTASNCLIVGPTGTGKTTGFVLPNLLQLGADRDMVVVDPKGTTLGMVGHALVAAGHDVSVLNISEPEKSDHYNPLAHIRSESDINAFVHCLLKNTNEGRDSTDPIWDNGEALLLTCILTLMLAWFDHTEMTFANMCALLSLVKPSEAGDTCPLALIIDEIRYGWRWVPDDGEELRASFDALDADEHPGLVRVPSLMQRSDGARPALLGPDGRPGLPDDRCVQLWDKFMSGNERTLQSFVISNNARLNYLTEASILKLLAAQDGRDELHFELLGQGVDELGRPAPPRVVFIVCHDSNSDTQALLALACCQALILPRNYADAHGGRLPRHLTLVLDEFTNIGHIDGIEQFLSTIRSRNMDAQVIVQSLVQLRQSFGPEGSLAIQDSCVNRLHIGGARATGSAEETSKQLGQTTAYKTETSTQRSAQGTSVSTSTSSYERALFDEAEISELPRGKCLVLIGSEHVIMDDTYRLRDHPHYEAAYMDDVSKPRVFDHIAWKRAGKPRGAALDAWEKVWFADVMPAREARDDLLQPLELTQNRLSDARHDLRSSRQNVSNATAAGVIHLIELRVRLFEARLAAADAACAHHEARALEAAGQPTPRDVPTDADIERLRRAAADLERRLIETLTPTELDVVIAEEERTLA